MTTPSTPDTGFRTRGQVSQQLKQAIFRHLQKELREAYRRTPERCRFNQEHDRKGSDSVRLCMYPDRDKNKPRRMICDRSGWGGLRQARECPQWEPKLDKEMIKARFRERLADPATRARTYPDIAALMWVLDGGVLDEIREAESEFDQTEPEISMEPDDIPPVEES